MSNYISKARTNYFKVTDMKKFISDLEKYDMANTISLAYNPVNEKDKEEILSFTESHGIQIEFSCHDRYPGTIAILMPDGQPTEDGRKLPLTPLIQEYISPDDACVITEAGWEKLRYVCGDVTVITKNSTSYRSLQNIGKDVAREMLGNQEWNTQIYY